MSPDIDRNDVLTAMRGIDLFKDVPENAVKLERLGGLTNRNFRIDSPRGRHVLRIPGAGTSEYINRRNEAHAARSAAKVGVNGYWFRANRRRPLPTALLGGRIQKKRRAETFELSSSTLGRMPDGRARVISRVAMNYSAVPNHGAR